MNDLELFASRQERLNEDRIIAADQRLTGQHVRHIELKERVERLEKMAGVLPDGAAVKAGREPKLTTYVPISWQGEAMYVCLPCARSQVGGPFPILRGVASIVPRCGRHDAPGGRDAGQVVQLYMIPPKAGL